MEKGESRLSSCSCGLLSTFYSLTRTPQPHPASHCEPPSGSSEKPASSRARLGDCVLCGCVMGHGGLARRMARGLPSGGSALLTSHFPLLTSHTLPATGPRSVLSPRTPVRRLSTSHFALSPLQSSSPADCRPAAQRFSLRIAARAGVARFLTGAARWG